MRLGVSGAAIPAHLPFAAEITQACAEVGFPPCLAYGVKINETALSTNPAEMQHGAIGGLMPDGSNAGRGIMQLTASFPPDWADPLANARYALSEFLVPAWTFWTTRTTLRGEDLVRCTAASFNCGLKGAWLAHLAGDVDSATTDRYGQRAVLHYRALIAGKSPI